MEDIEYTTCVPFLVTVATEEEKARPRKNDWFPWVMQEEAEA